MTQPLEEYTEQQIPVDQSDDGVWGTSTIATLNLFGRALAGVVSIAAAAVATVTLDTTQAQKSVIVVTGTPSVDVTILVPNGLKRRYKARSAIGLTNQKKVLFNTVGGTGPSIELFPGQTLQFYSDGSRVYALNHPVMQGGGFPDTRYQAGVGQPGIYFDSDKLAGFARIGNGIFVHPGAVGGVGKPYIGFLKGNTVAEPAFAFSTDFLSYNSGFYFPDDNTLAFTLKGNEKLRLSETVFYIGRSNISENVEGAYFALDGGQLTIERMNGGLARFNRMGSLTEGGGRIIQFFYNGILATDEAGSIRLASTSSVSYATTSDARRKQGVHEPGDLWGMVHAVRPKLFQWRGGSGLVLGVIAQEAQAPWRTMEGAITGDPDGKEMMGADYGRITPMLLWAIQDLDRRLREIGR